MGYIHDMVTDVQNLIRDLEWLEENFGMTRDEAIGKRSEYSDIGWRNYKGRIKQLGQV